MNAATLHQRTRAAIAELRALRCADPAAQEALDAVRLTAHTLEHWWLPELTRLAAEPEHVTDPGGRASKRTGNGELGWRR